MGVESLRIGRKTKKGSLKRRSFYIDLQLYYFSRFQRENFPERIFYRTWQIILARRTLPFCYLPTSPPPAFRNLKDRAVENICPQTSGSDGIVAIKPF